MRHPQDDALHGVGVRRDVKDPLQRVGRIGLGDDEAVEEHEDRHARGSQDLRLASVTSNRANEREQGVVDKEEQQGPRHNGQEHSGTQLGEEHHDHHVEHGAEESQRHVDELGGQRPRHLGVQLLRGLVFHQGALVDQDYQAHRSGEAQHGQHAKREHDLPQEILVAGPREHVPHDGALDDRHGHGQPQSHRVPNGQSQLASQQFGELAAEGERVVAHGRCPPARGRAVVRLQHLLDGHAHLRQGLANPGVDEGLLILLERFHQHVRNVGARPRRRGVHEPIGRVDIDRDGVAALLPVRLRRAHGAEIHQASGIRR
mmetsp:Transcript_88058/g.269420  ORF Transcript_88058/g.269420 Transcript_88058/m.269420 type:complete len:316 (-) Transcript_88058:838-1785(-)